MSPTDNPPYTVTVRYGTNIPVSKEVAQELESSVLKMLRSANYNSGKPHKGVWQRPERVSEIARYYRNLTANGKYVLVVWAQPRQIQTALGEITAIEAIVEVERPNAGCWMCSLDPDGRLVHLGKFDGRALLSMEKLVRELAK